jgi:hypothetical protein
MQVKFIKSGIGGHTEIEFISGEVIHKMGTFCVQIPPQIMNLKSKELFEIPDDFMRTQLQLPNTEDPVKWYHIGSSEAWAIVNSHEKAEAVNTIFRKFMDAVGLFCGYNRKAAMERHERWAEETFPQL